MDNESISDEASEILACLMPWDHLRRKNVSPIKI